MTDSTNPYQGPQTSVGAIRPALSTGTLTEVMVFYLRDASPWMRFLGIIGYISCGFMVLGGIFMAFLPAVFLGLHEVSEAGIAVTAGMGAFGGAFYIIIAVAMFFPARWLYKTGVKIRGYVRTGADSDLEEAFRSNRAFWKFMGIMTIISLAGIPVLIIVGVLAVVGTTFM
ncbi:MAG: hypothetical protein LBQ57_12165 [Spirochaetales bacterium]|jgi:hypothetical protein|nr:hypothetical protein [Spirochaetales bacterium]